MSHLQIIDSRGERKICREHGIAFSEKRCPRCQSRLDHADAVFAAMLRTQAAIADGSISKSLIREAMYA